MSGRMEKSRVYTSVVGHQPTLCDIVVRIETMRVETKAFVGQHTTMLVLIKDEGEGTGGLKEEGLVEQCVRSKFSS